ncbi:hypothetical protein [Roseobacter weihaiensis]|uniref:hypothetical protein n=1 Tax=Roseobacter weihaiensis TaxID=2763262 RepID=UPI001D0BDB6A|nr:hypothetical protein [Roseobacter sp. H9]
MRNTIIAASTLGLVACGEVRPNLTDARPTGTGAVPPSQALGVFRHVCLDQNPREKLLFPFSQENETSFKHADFDMRFVVTDASCSMIVKPKEHEGKASAEFGNQGPRTATERLLEELGRNEPEDTNPNSQRRLRHCVVTKELRSQHNGRIYL